MRRFPNRVPFPLSVLHVGIPWGRFVDSWLHGEHIGLSLCQTKPWRIIVQHGRPAAYYLNCALRSTSVEVNRSPFFKAPLKRKRPMCVSMSRCTLCIYLYHPWCLFLSVENSGLTRNFHPPLESPRLASNLTPRDFKIMCLHCQNLLLWQQLVIIKDLLSSFNESPRR